MSVEEKTEPVHQDEAYKRYLLKKKIQVLKQKTGFHTALVSLFIPPSRKIFDVISYLKSEINESSNIKSKSNRKNVLDSITSLIGQLRTIKTVPPNGLIMYCGQIPVNNAPGTEKNEIYIIEPPEPVTTFKYHCSSTFLLDPLYDMIEEKGTYGIINIENKEAAIGYVKGSHLELYKTMTSGIHSKHDAGGQSQRRMERLIEEGAQQFYIRVGEDANECFLNINDLKGIFISGAGMAKEKFRDKGVLDYRLQDKVIDLVDVSYSGFEGIRETIIKIQDKLESLRYVQEKKIFTRFMNEVVKDTGKIVYGEVEVRRALMMGAIELLLLSDSLTLKRVKLECSNCQYKDEKTIKETQINALYDELRGKPCPKCNTMQYQVQDITDVLEDMGQLAETQGTKVELLTRETEEGESLYSTFGGIAAILRWKI
jgi:peptide chain release factor subunit 1